jgi:hypothetical protein
MKKWIWVVAVGLLIGACGEEGGGGGGGLTYEQKQEIANEKIAVSLAATKGMVDMAFGAIELFSQIGGMRSQGSPLKAQQNSQCPVLDNFNLSGNCQSQDGCDVNLTLDWGEGCAGDDGILRKGKITIFGHITSTSLSATAEFENFEEEGNKISSGTLSVDIQKTDKGWDATITAKKIKGVNEDGNYSADFSLDISTDARGTEDDSDDLITLNGNGKLSSDEGSISITIKDVIQDNQVCEEHPTSGTVEIEIDSDEADGTIKFTFHEQCDGKVDVQADLKIDGSSVKVNTSVPIEE